MKERKLLYFVNPISGTRRKGKLVEQLHKLNRSANINYTIEYTNAQGDYSYLVNYIIEHDITDVIICGGDGTVSTITSFLLASPVNVGIVPMGSGNGLALAARIPYDLKKAMRIIFHGHSQLVDGFRINGMFSCMMCGVGNDAEIAHEFALTKVRGLKTYLKLSLKKYFSMKPYSFTIMANNSTHTVDAFFITVSNANQFGNNVTIAPRASLNDGLLDIVVVSKMNLLRLPIELFRQIVGINALSEISSSSGKRGVVYFQSDRIKIINNNLAPIHIDGEPYAAAAEITIEIIPGAFRLLQPSRS
jgi:diacylglycerol kinase (ATP)